MSERDAQHSTQPPAPVPPESKDWTGVITQGCAECGFTPQLTITEVGSRLRATIPRWQAVLARPDVTVRPAPLVWSPLEYACHVRDVCALFRYRLGLMVEHDGASFEDWDQDATAQAEAYWAQDPARVASQFADEASRTAEAFDAVPAEANGHRGMRSNGSQFTIASFGPYFVHDIEHHLHDVGG